MPDLLVTKQSDYYKSRTSVIIRIVSILVVSTIGIFDSAFAEDLDRYCLSTIGQVEPQKPEKAFTQHPVPPHLNQEVNDLPELYRKPCNAFSRFFDACTGVTFFSYSPTLDRIFFKGYRPTRWGGGFVHLEISEEGTKSVPSELVNSGFAEDIPALNGVLFGGRIKKEALFYDGDKVTDLSQYFPEPGKRKSSRRGWIFQETFENRFFLVSAGHRSRGFPFVAEIKPGPSLSIISVPKELENTWLQLLTLPNDSRIWGISRNNILLETERKLQKVLTVSSPLYIVIPGFVKPVDESILFEIRSEDTESITNYFLREASPTANCEIMLDLDKPVLLDPELNN